MSPRWRKVLQDLWINKTRTVLVMLSIAVGVFAIGVMAGTQVILTREVKRVYDATHAASATLSSTFDDDFIDAVRRMPEVGDATGRREATVRAHIGAGTGLRSLLLVALRPSDYNDQRLNMFLPAGGTWPPAKRTLLIERLAAADMGVTIGSTLTVDLPNGSVRIIEVSGLTYDFLSPPPILGGISYAYITLDTLEWLGFARTYNRLNIAVATDPLNRQHIQDVADLVKHRIENDTGLSVSGIRIPDPGKPTLDNAVQAILLILGTLGALSLLTSGFLIVNVISALLAQDVRQIGVMKSFGARAYQITGMYLGMVLIFGALGLAVALPLGVLGAQWLVNFGAGLLNVEVADISLPLQVLVLQAVVGLAVPVLASLYPVFSGARITVHQAINSYGVEGHFGESVFDRVIARVHFLSRPLMLSLRNTFRRKGRLAFTLITLTLGGAIFVGVFCVRDALLRTLDDSQRYWQYNIAVYTNRFHSIELLERQALSMPGVVRAEAWGGSNAVRVFTNGLLSRSFSIDAPPAQTELIKPIMVSGRWLLPSDTNALVVNTDMLGDHPDLHVGSTLRIKMDDHQSDWEVVGIARSVLTGRVAYMNYPAYARRAQGGACQQSRRSYGQRRQPDRDPHRRRNRGSV